jgi:hypothetical protein
MGNIFTMQELDAFVTKPKRLFKFLRDRALLLPLRTACPHSPEDNQHLMEVIKREKFKDGLSYYCNTCRTEYSIRHKSIFERSEEDLLVCCRMLVCFDIHITVTQTSSLLGISRKIVGHFYELIRDKLFHYMYVHFKKFRSHEVLEIDKMFLRHLVAIGPDQETLPATWIFGIISRTTGRVYLQIIPDRISIQFKNIFNNCVQPGALVLSDGWNY